MTAIDSASLLDGLLGEELETLERAGLRRRLRTVERLGSGEIIVDGRRVMRIHQQAALRLLDNVADLVLNERSDSSARLVQDRRTVTRRAFCRSEPSHTVR
jgi:hypothetical protein